MRLKEAGFYTYREHLVGTDLIAETTTECAVVAETTLARPLIITGRNDVDAARRASRRTTRSRRRACGSTSLGIDAPVSPGGRST